MYELQSQTITINLLHYIIEWSKCNKFLKQYFKHLKYSFKINIKALK